jgi:hypothetical protein
MPVKAPGMIGRTSQLLLDQQLRYSTFHHSQTGPETFALPGLPGRLVRFIMINTGVFRRAGRQLLRGPAQNMDSNERIAHLLKTFYCAAIKIE